MAAKAKAKTAAAAAAPATAAAASPDSPDVMVEQVFDQSKHDAVAAAIQQLSPEEAQYFLEKLERAIRKRKVQLVGYLVAMVLWLVGMVFALGIYGAAPEGKFVGWVFIVPFAIVGLVLFVVGKYSERVGRAPLPSAQIHADPKK